MFSKDNVFLGIAPIAWTNDDMPDLGKENSFEQCISEAALAGFAGTEVGNKYPRDPETLKRYLGLRNLRIASAWFSSFLTTKPLEDTMGEFIKHRDFLHAMGAKVIVVSEQGGSIQGQIDTPVFGEKPVLNDEGWRKLCTGLEKLGACAAEKDMKLVYHHHMGTVVQTAEEVDKLMQGTNPSLVYLLFDSGHLAYAGADANAVLQKYVSRVKHVHLKDIRADIVEKVKADNASFLQGVRLGAFTVPGDGSIDFAPIFKTLSHANYEGWLLVEAEQDPAIANPLEYAFMARKYIHSQTGL